MATHLALSLTRPAPAALRRALAAPALLAAPLFLIAVAALSWLDRDALQGWGWTPLDHHGVPWPSSVATGPHGWLQVANFALAGAALLALTPALRAKLPRRRSSAAATIGLALTGCGLLGAAFPLDRPLGDPAALSSWVQSWHAAIHVGGFLLAGLGGLFALAAFAAATRREWRRLSRSCAILAGLLTITLALPSTVGWYLFLAGLFGWVATVALWLRKSHDIRRATTPLS
jgi:hypothetical protein